MQLEVKGMSISIQVNLTNFDVLSSCFECLFDQYPEAVGQAMMNVAQNILATANTLVQTAPTPAFLASGNQSNTFKASALFVPSLYAVLLNDVLNGTVATVI